VSDFNTPPDMVSVIHALERRIARLETSAGAGAGRILAYDAAEQTIPITGTPVTLVGTSVATIDVPPGGLVQIFASVQNLHAADTFNNNFYLYEPTDLPAGMSLIQSLGAGTYVTATMLAFIALLPTPGRRSYSLKAAAVNSSGLARERKLWVMVS
jgi:hypothetical protein